DWISRRDEIGAPSESEKDPYLVSTMSAHRGNSSDLYDISRAIRENSPSIMLGIEQTPISGWTLNGVQISEISGGV
ncbi:MAG: hypothetical protein VYE10_04160, partial [Candidatus Thermoplasmatota archaeon]|nr:hypothetical protein [Candidatus Thermoplasmatota archaeon]